MLDHKRCWKTSSTYSVRQSYASSTTIALFFFILQHCFCWSLLISFVIPEALRALNSVLSWRQQQKWKGEFLNTRLINAFFITWSGRNTFFLPRLYVSCFDELLLLLLLNVPKNSFGWRLFHFFITAWNWRRRVVFKAVTTIIINSWWWRWWSSLLVVVYFTRFIWRWWRRIGGS